MAALPAVPTPAAAHGIEIPTHRRPRRRPRRRCRRCRRAHRTPPCARPCRRAVSCASLYELPRHRRERPPRRCSRAVVAAAARTARSARRVAPPPACHRRRPDGQPGAGLQRSRNSYVLARARSRPWRGLPTGRAGRWAHGGSTAERERVAIGRSANQAGHARGVAPTPIRRQSAGRHHEQRARAGCQSPRPNTRSTDAAGSAQRQSRMSTSLRAAG